MGDQLGFTLNGKHKYFGLFYFSFITFFFFEAIMAIGQLRKPRTMLENVVKFHFFSMVKYARVEALESEVIHRTDSIETMA